MTLLNIWGDKPPLKHDNEEQEASGGYIYVMDSNLKSKSPKRKTKPQRNWNDAEVEKLKSMWDQGLSVGHISKKLGRTKGSVHAMSHRLKLPIAKKWQDSELDFIERNFRNLSIREIARRLGRSPSAISKKIREFKENE